MMRFGFPLIVCAVAAAACGHGSPPREVLAQSQDSPQITETDSKPEHSTPPQANDDSLISLIQKDELASANVLREAMAHGGNATLSAFAAVTVLHLGIQHNRREANRALIRGTRSKNLLLASLCWRWLATDKSFRLPQKPKFAKADPVVRVIAAVAAVARGKVPNTLSGALGMPDQPLPESAPNQKKEARARVIELLRLSQPFDGGPLALAIAFVEARRKEWTEKTEAGKMDWVARRIRRELLQITLGKGSGANQRIQQFRPANQESFSAIDRLLENPFLSQSQNMLHSIAVTGTPKLRAKALNAMAILIQKPTTADFGASAAALSSDEPYLRLTGARTFLILSKRVRQNP